MSNYIVNKNARITSRIDRNGKVRTETARRDVGTLDFAISTNPRTNSTRLFIDGIYADGSLALDGHEARSLYRLLQKHYDAVGR